MNISNEYKLLLSLKGYIPVKYRKTQTCGVINNLSNDLCFIDAGILRRRNIIYRDLFERVWHECSWDCISDENLKRIYDELN